MRSNIFHNPVLKGFYPDPSICRVGDTYYMVTSSFYYFPGLPVFRSRDLVHWEQIGNAISRPDQIDFRNCDSSEGLWAATIRYYDNKFYIINTLDVNGRADRYNYIITAADPAGEWSDAVIIEGADGIDPSLYFDEDGSMWYCSNRIPSDLKYPTHKVIYLCELDKETFQFKGEQHVIYDSSMDYSLYMEAPHVYKIDGMYYLITAEGGTQTNHCVKIYRSDSLTGSYAPCPRNPIVTNRGLRLVNELGVSVVGHGDLVHTQNDEWYMVVLGIRPYHYELDPEQYYRPKKWIRVPERNQSAQYNIGRETFLVPIAWDTDGWPIVDNENGMVNLVERRPDLPYYRAPYQSRVDNFENDRLDMVWCMRRPVQEPFYTLKDRPGYLRLKLLPVMAEDKKTPAILVRRQQHNEFQIAVAMEFEPLYDGEEAGLILTQNELYAFLLVKECREQEIRITCYRIAGGKRQILSSVAAAEGRLYLFIEGGEAAYSFYYGTNEREMIPLVENTDGTYMSSIVADGYIGSFVGMYASCGHENGDNVPEHYADYDWFRYEAIEE